MSSNDDDALLNVSELLTHTRVNGPGLRAAVWVQGCTLKCPGCFNAVTHPHRARTLMDPEALADQLMLPEHEGLTILGGEPFEQAAACARLASRAAKHGKSVVTYSGYTYERLRNSTRPDVLSLLNATDLLIAGPFVAAARNGGAGWHGSSNQEFVFLSDRYDERIREQWEELPEIELHLSGTDVVVTGIPRRLPVLRKTLDSALQ